LRNSTQNIRLNDASGAPILDFDYEDSWEPSTDGDGHSLVIVSPTADPLTWNVGSSWRASFENEGSPGREDTHPSLRVPGDLNGSGSLEVSDVTGFLFGLAGLSVVTPCFTGASNLALQDIDGDGVLTVNDAVHLLRFLFLAGPPPEAGSACTPMPGCPRACGQ
jgi:hypothetical protein